MGTLDDAIREHLELKRRQGAGEDEIQRAEAEAFGPSDEDVPGASLTAPAGEGDQLDKVFAPGEAPGEAPPTTVMDSGTEAPPAPGAETTPEQETRIVGNVEVEAAEVVEAPPEPEPPAPSPETAEALPEEPESIEAEAVEDLDAPPAPEPVDLGDEADASDLLEAERANLAGHPTENYDVDAAIAEEEELDLLSEGRLSEELDRALDGPGLAEGGGLGGEPSSEPTVPEGVGEVEEVVEIEEATEVEDAPVPAEETPVDDPEATSPLEETPDFLEESPTSDELWFEQGEPKDFDFGD